MPMVKGDPIYGTEPRPEQTDFGDGDYGYESSYTTGYFSEPDEYGDRDWIGNPTNIIIGYGPDVFVPGTPAASTPAASTPAASTPVASTPVASTPVASTPVASTPAATPYTPPDLGLDIPPGNIGGDGVPPVGPPGDLGLGIPAAPTYYEEFVPPQQPVVPQLTQAELLQQIVDEGASSDDDSAPGFQDGGLATPNLNPVAQNQGLTSENLPSEGVLEVLRSFNQEGNGARFNVLPNLGEAIRQNRPITRADLTGTEAGLSGTRPVGGGEIGYRLDATLDPLDTGGVVGGVDYDVGYKFGKILPFMKRVLRPTGGGVGIRGAVEGNTADPELSPASQKEIYGNLGLNIPLTGTNIEGSFVTPKDTSTEYNLRVNQPVGPANFGYERNFLPERGDAEKFSLNLPNLEASYSKSPFGTNTLQGGVNFPVGDNTYVSLEGGQQKRKGSTQKDWAARIDTDVNGTGIGALLRGDSSRNKELEVKVDRPLPGFIGGTGNLSGKLFQKFNSTGPNPLNFEVAAEVPVSRDLTAAISGNIERSREGNTFGGQLELKAMQDRLGLLAKYETGGEKSVGVRYNLPTDKIPDSLKNLFR